MGTAIGSTKFPRLSPSVTRYGIPALRVSRDREYSKVQSLRVSSPGDLL